MTYCWSCARYLECVDKLDRQPYDQPCYYGRGDGEYEYEPGADMPGVFGRILPGQDL